MGQKLYENTYMYIYSYIYTYVLYIEEKKNIASWQFTASKNETFHKR